jgi:Protein of unknown function (DUF2911)
MRAKWIGAAAMVLSLTLFASAQQGRPMSPRETAAVQVGGQWVKPQRQGGDFTLGGQTYQGGKWVEINYSAPLKRGRDLWGSGANYGKGSLVGAPIWRAGADETTRLKTDVPLVIAGKTLAPGEYSLFIDLKENNWTFVVSTQPAQKGYDPNEKVATYGAYNYTPAKDVLRTKMKLETLPHAVEQLTWAFVDVTDAGGAMAISWGNQMASVPFSVGK